jgi:hypothetical protein
MLLSRLTGAARSSDNRRLVAKGDALGNKLFSGGLAALSALILANNIIPGDLILKLLKSMSPPLLEGFELIICGGGASKDDNDNFRASLEDCFKIGESCCSSRSFCWSARFL